jgi:hypothetical protein
MRDTGPHLTTRDAAYRAAGSTKIRMCFHTGHFHGSPHFLTNVTKIVEMFGLRQVGTVAKDDTFANERLLGTLDVYETDAAALKERLDCAEVQRLARICNQVADMPSPLAALSFPSEQGSGVSRTNTGDSELEVLPDPVWISWDKFLTYPLRHVARRFVLVKTRDNNLSFRIQPYMIDAERMGHHHLAESAYTVMAGDIYATPSSAQA